MTKYFPAAVVVTEIGFPAVAAVFEMQVGVAGETEHGWITYALTGKLPVIETRSWSDAPVVIR